MWNGRKPWYLHFRDVPRFCEVIFLLDLLVPVLVLVLVAVAAVVAAAAVVVSFVELEIAQAPEFIGFTRKVFWGFDLLFVGFLGELPGSQESSRQFNADSQLEEELTRSLQQLRRDTARKDAAIKNLRTEVHEARRSDEQSSAHVAESVSGAASTHAKLKLELTRKDQALHHAEARMQLLKARLVAEEQMAAQAAQAAAQAAASSRLHLASGRGRRVSSEKSLELEPSTVSDSFQDESVRSSGVAALEQELSGMLLRAGSIESSWEHSAVRESLEILNLQLEDLPEFLRHAPDREPTDEKCVCVLTDVDILSCVMCHVFSVSVRFLCS